MKPIILLDIDGTLIDEGGNYPPNFKTIKEQIKLLKKNKFIIGICSHRPFDYNVKKIVRNYQLNGPIITEGGACIFQKKRFKYRIVSNNKKFSLNKLVKDLITCFVRKNNIKIPIKITSNFNNNDSIVINKYRNQTATIRFPEKMDQQFDLIIDYLKNSPKLSNMNITKNSNYKTKINIFPKNINKISSIEKNFKNKNVIFITDFEENLSMHNSLIKVYSVGVSKEFNDYCDEVFSPFSKGVEEILIKLRREL